MIDEKMNKRSLVRDEKIIEKWKSLGYCSITNLSKNTGVSENICHEIVNDSFKFRIFESKINKQQEG